MKNILNHIASLFLLTTVYITADSNKAMAQAQETDTVVIKTSAVCDMCEERILKAVRFVKGVKENSFNMETKEVTVVFRTDKTDAGKIREAISHAGYDADDIKADPKAFSKLPGCCQKGHD